METATPHLARWIRGERGVNFQDNDRNIIPLWQILRKGADGIVKVVNDLEGRIAPVDARDVECPLSAEGGIVGGTCLDNAVGDEEDEVAGFQGYRAAAGEIAVRENAKRQAR